MLLQEVDAEGPGLSGCSVLLLRDVDWHRSRGAPQLGVCAGSSPVAEPSPCAGRAGPRPPPALPPPLPPPPPPPPAAAAAAAAAPRRAAPGS